VRVGGYGGAEGLARYLREEGIDLLIDATHPYAAQISRNAARLRAGRHPCWACAARPGRRKRGRLARGRGLGRTDRGTQAVPRPLFTLGREPLQHLDEIPPQQFWTLRALDACPGNERCEVIGARGPFHIEDERALFAPQIDVLISKNSGSVATEPKLEVARELGCRCWC
jgi:precorrin-6A/cobalt-precorrin-6A reductase